MLIWSYLTSQKAWPHGSLNIIYCLSSSSLLYVCSACWYWWKFWYIVQPDHHVWNMSQAGNLPESFYTLLDAVVLTLCKIHIHQCFLYVSLACQRAPQGPSLREWVLKHAALDIRPLRYLCMHVVHRLLWFPTDFLLQVCDKPSVRCRFFKPCFRHLQDVGDTTKPRF